jgi:DNA-binding NtrC family response regulator
MKSDSSGRVLIVDDDRDVLFTARLVMKGLFEKVDAIDRPGLIPEFLKTSRYEVILLDMNFSRGDTSGKEGLEWLDRILRQDSGVRVLATTAYGEINLAVQAMKKGAADFIVKPWNKAQLVAAVQNAVRLKALKSTGKTNSPGADPGENPEGRNPEGKNHEGKHPEGRHPEIISRSPSMAQILETIKTVAPTDANVLIMGENGTGKELAAVALHRESLRSRKQFVHVDLGSIPETLFEAELFGHTRGAFTDAREERAGRFETASGGTLFLDEIGNLTLPLQAKILTAIQNKQVTRIGSNNPVPTNVRLISATNMPLYQMAESFEFRQDLLYRINTVEILLPPLRERREDISLLVEYYLKHFSEQYGKEGIRIREGTLAKLEEYHWPGNIRELAHSIERAVILCKSGGITPEDFMFRARPSVAVAEETTFRLEDYDRKAVAGALSRHNGNLSKAAEELGIARSTLYRKISHFGI